MSIDDVEIANDAINNEIRVTARYIENYSGDIKREITGILYHEITHIWQWDRKGQASRGLIVGISEYVRIKAGLAPSCDWVTFGHVDRWDQGVFILIQSQTDIKYWNSTHTIFWPNNTYKKIFKPRQNRNTWHMSHKPILGINIKDEHATYGPTS
ncbi:hypothetical protein RND71_035533 [Anisodus tanguticus]|uniref:Plant basic secretory protein (BSP) family protein n=1 Tax=Anisodus tanguticus TaxID=243964 RepID=A0AAE1R778_9SOLA|nr:hypothetical protein RND71_035533 [Anisodus tanguticus]